VTRTELLRQINALERREALGSSGDLATEIRRRVEDWQGLMTRHPAQARQLLRKMLQGRPIVCVPTEENGELGYRFRGEAPIAQLLSGLPFTVASPAGTNAQGNIEFERNFGAA
jgi:hypothetical protein